MSGENAEAGPITELSAVAGDAERNDDLLRVTSSDSSAVRVFQFASDRYSGSVDVPPDLHGSSPLTRAMPEIKAMVKGVAVITVTDVSNPTHPSAHFT